MRKKNLKKRRFKNTINAFHYKVNKTKNKTIVISGDMFYFNFPLKFDKSFRIAHFFELVAWTLPELNFDNFD